MSGTNPTGLGCCDDGTPLVAVWNRPSLSQVAYRIGAHSVFKAAMLARLSAKDMPALRPLTQRDDRDPTIALLDTAAVLADILTFYQERIATESWLRTATERRSLVAMGRLIGYEPAPGLAASTHLAFTIESADPTLQQLAIPTGTRVQSIPPPGAQAVVFETIEDIVARPEWNAISPVMQQPHPTLSAATEQLLIQGARADIQTGETILLVYGSDPADRTVKRLIHVEVAADSQSTRLDLADAPASPPPYSLPVFAVGTFELSLRPLNNFTMASSVLGRSWRMADLDAYAVTQNWAIVSMRRNLQTQRDQRTMPPEMGAHRFRRVASIFGHNAPAYMSLPATQRYPQAVVTNPGSTPTTKTEPAVYPSNWDAAGHVTLADDVAASGFANTIDLDDRYVDAVPGTWAVLGTGTGTTLAANITHSDDVARSDFTLNGKVTRLGLDTSDGFSGMNRRAVSVQVSSEALVLADIPVTAPISGNQIILDSAYLGLQVGRPIVVSGTRADLDGVQDAEVAWISDIALVDGLTVLTLSTGLTNTYLRSTATISANVALATQGQSQAEALGSGDARQGFQRFKLRQPPLTYVPDSSSAGARSTLVVTVNQERWQEVPNLFGAGPHDKVFVTFADDGTVVEFGDGNNGALLPTGLENVQATYRQGTGTAGLVAPNTLSVALVRPAGVRSVTNPVASGDAAEPDGPDLLRANAALRIKTLDRVVSLQDYEDFARAFSGIGKALASWTWDGRTRGVFLTVAGPDGRTIDPAGLVATSLTMALRDSGDPRVPISVASYIPAFFRIHGRLRIAAALDAGTVNDAVAAALRAAFSFSLRDFGAAVALSEVLAAIHSVPGVIAFDPDLFTRSDTGTGVSDLLVAAVPHAGEASPAPAELLLLDPRLIAFGTLP